MLIGSFDHKVRFLEDVQGPSEFLPMGVFGVRKSMFAKFQGIKRWEAGKPQMGRPYF